MSGNHAARAHAAWSASASARNFACPGALAMSEGIPEPKESEAAAWGTACHEVSEWCLTTGGEPIERVDRVIKTKDHAIEVTEEMAETAAVYADYVRDVFQKAQACSTKAWLKIEQKFSLAKLNPPMDGGGTGDAVIWDGIDLLEVVDLKGGRGVVVEVEGNKQLRTYGLGAVLNYPGLPVKRVRVTIVQPRAPHASGRIRSEEFHAADLVDFASDILDGMAASKAAFNDRAVLAPEAFAEKYLRVGEHCRFCPALATCPAQRAKALKDAQAWFGNDGALHVPEKHPSDLSMEELAAILDGADGVQDWLNACRAYAHQLVEGGTQVGNYILVDKQARRQWVDEAAATAAVEARIGAKAFKRKLITPAQAEKEIGKKDFAALAATLVKAESSGTNLVRADKTTRPAATPKAASFFDVIT